MKEKLFSIEKEISKENDQFSRWNFFPFPENAHDAQLPCCRIVGGLYNTYAR